MSDARSVLSLKGDSPIWRGMADTTSLAPAPGTFEVLEGLVVSRDGTELQPMGAQLSGKPFYGQAYSLQIGGIVVGVGITTIFLDAGAARDNEALLPPFFYVIPHLAGHAATPLEATKLTANTFSVPVEFTSTVVTGYVLIQRISSEHAMAGVDGRPAVVVETTVYDSALSGGTYYKNLATAVCKTPLSTTSPPTPGKPDGTDANFVLWPSPTMTALNDCDYAAGTARAKAMRHYDIVRRMHTASLNGRLLIAVPGLAIMFEANVRNHFQTLSTRPPLNANWPDSRWTKALGVPRPPVPGVPITLSGAGSLSNGADNRWFTFAIGYYNPASGEVGVPSPPFAIHVSSAEANDTASVKAIYPRGALLEAVGLQIILYASLPTMAANDDAGRLEALSAELFPIEAFGPFTTAGELSLLATDASTETYYTFVVTTVPSDESQVNPKRFPVIELPPPGASWVSVAKARMFAGGEMPEWWDMKAWPMGRQKLGFTGSLDLEYLLTPPTMWDEPDSVPTSSPCSFSQWPMTFGGRTVAEIGTANTTRIGLDEGLVNQRETSDTVGPHTHLVDFRLNDTATGNFTSGNLANYRFFTPQDRLTIAEEGYPGVCPAISQLPIDVLASMMRTTGKARVGDQAVIFTAQQTNIFSWAAMPRAPASNVLSNSHGCASPNSVVEGPGFAAWLSMSGPCTWSGGGVRWVGDRLATFWATVKRDSEGMVVCQGVAIDIENTRVIWSLLTNTTSAWTAATTDTLKHKVAGDTLLVWNWTADAFSVQRREDVREVRALGVMPYDDGTMRPTVSVTAVGDVAIYRPLYALTGGIERGSAVDEITLTADRNPADSLAVFSDSVDYGLGDYAFVRSQDGSTCRWLGQLGGVTSTATTQLTLGQASTDADGAMWYVGDVVVVGGPHTLLRTHRLKVGDLGGGMAVDGWVIHIDLEATHCYAKIALIHPDGTRRALKPAWGQRLHNGSNRLLGLSVADDMAIEMTLVADGWFAIKDLGPEVQDGSR